MATAKIINYMNGIEKLPLADQWKQCGKQISHFARVCKKAPVQEKKEIIKAWEQVVIYRNTIGSQIMELKTFGSLN